MYFIYYKEGFYIVINLIVFLSVKKSWKKNENVTKLLFHRIERSKVTRELVDSFR